MLTMLANCHICCTVDVFIWTGGSRWGCGVTADPPGIQLRSPAGLDPTPLRRPWHREVGLPRWLGPRSELWRQRKTHTVNLHFILRPLIVISHFGLLSTTHRRRGHPDRCSCSDHLQTQLGGAGDQTSNLQVIRQPTLHTEVRQPFLLPIYYIPILLSRLAFTIIQSDFSMLYIFWTV